MREKFPLSLLYPDVTRARPVLRDASSRLKAPHDTAQGGAYRLTTHRVEAVCALGGAVYVAGVSHGFVRVPQKRESPP